MRLVTRHLRQHAAVSTALALCLVLVGATGRDRVRPAAEAAVAIRAQIARDADSLDASLVMLVHTLSAPATDTTRIRAAFRSARTRYKRVEGVLEFYAPALAASFNARRQELDDDDAPPPSVLTQTGFPALEGVLWPSRQPSHPDSARRIAARMRPLAARFRAFVPALVPTQAQLIEIARLELARVGTLGIAGFDTPATHDAMRESADALAGLRVLFDAAGAGLWPGQTTERAHLATSLTRAASYLRAHDDFDTFNRLAFITAYADSSARAVDALRRTANVVSVRIPRAWRFDAPWVYSANAFDARAYAPSGTPAVGVAIIALGAQLFHEPALSGTGLRSCASCHQPARSFTDGLVTAASIDRRGSRVTRNTPTLINASLQPAQFADERSVTLDDQVVEVLRSPAEMASSVERAVAALRKKPHYVVRFATAFGADSPSTITAVRLRQALAAYVRSLVALDSRFDRAVRGDTSAMSAQERHGFTLFMGKAACGTCHFAPLFNGNTPPHYMNADVEVIGTSRTARYFAHLDADSGRARIDKLPLHYRAFKTPTLRNIVKTAPYMHNGGFRTLDEVVRFYDGGGGQGAGARIGNQTLSPDSLHLPIADQRALVAFLATLTSSIR